MEVVVVVVVAEGRVRGGSGFVDILGVLLFCCRGLGGGGGGGWFGSGKLEDAGVWGWRSGVGGAMRARGHVMIEWLFAKQVIIAVVLHFSKLILWVSRPLQVAKPFAASSIKRNTDASWCLYAASSKQIPKHLSSSQQIVSGIFLIAVRDVTARPLQVAKPFTAFPTKRNADTSLCLHAASSKQLSKHLSSSS